MIASLPMYDRPETRAANDRFYQAIREAYPCSMPIELTRDGDPSAQWNSPDLVLSQTCGLPFRAGLHDHVHLVASPVHALDCPPGYYFSVIVGHKDRPLTSNPKFAINEGLSQSGWAAAHAWSKARNYSIAEVVVTGTHAASAETVAFGMADLAAIDAVTWELLLRYEGFTENLVVVDQTPPTPALPYITADPDAADPLFKAIELAISSLSDTDKFLLYLTGVTRIPKETYLAQPMPPAPPT